MMKFFGYIGIAITGFLAVVMLSYFAPELYRRMVITVDVLSVTEEARYERTRVATIMNLPIRYEQKQVLVEHKVFMGATPDMAQLALGAAHHISTAVQPNGVPRLVLHFYLQGDARPTVLEFENNALVNAYKGSSLDIMK